jgi:hypothetical protein
MVEKFTSSAYESNELEKEPWDYVAFIKIHNQIADNDSGYHYIEDDDTQYLHKNYLEGSWETMQDFAKGVFGSEQRVDDIDQKYKGGMGLARNDYDD